VTPAAINFSGLVGKVDNDADKMRLLGLQKTHETSKSALNVKGSVETIDWAKWGADIKDQSVVAEIQAAFESVSLPDTSDTTTVEHPAWDADEFDRLAAAMDLENEEIASKSSKLTAYLQYMDDLPPVTEMTVEDVLSKDASLDDKIQRELNELELHNVVIPGERAVSHTPETDPRKKLDPLFPNTNIIEAINAPARALASEILGSTDMVQAIAQSGVDADAFGEAVEGLLCQAPLLDDSAVAPELDFSSSSNVLREVIGAQFSDLSEEATDSLVAVFDEHVAANASGDAEALQEAQAEAVASVSSSILSGAPSGATTTAVFLEANSGEWYGVASSLLNVEKGLDGILAAAGDESAAIGSMVESFDGSADGARNIAAAYSLACSDSAQTEAMVNLLEAHVIQGALFNDAGLKEQLASVFSSEEEQKAAYAAWWPANGGAVAISSPFDNVSEAAAADPKFGLTKATVQKHMLSIE